VHREDSELREERIGGEKVYSGRILDLEVDRVRLPHGGEALREVVRHRGAVVILPLLGDGGLVLVRQHRYPTGEILLELPAGKLDPGESPVACALRELEEETGWRAAEATDLGWFYTTPGFSDEVLHAFCATGLKPSSDHLPDPDEAIEVVTLNIESALEACRDGGIRDGKTIATLFRARLRGLI
jgi:ADP-ribose pyrophosphatase